VWERLSASMIAAGKPLPQVKKAHSIGGPDEPFFFGRWRERQAQRLGGALTSCG
jgi:hypothetical protein